jgi:D-glycero-D-manno-heptose 1,7-bisphosphate phosphatase
MVKAVFLDRDGVINNDTGHYYIYQTNDFVLNERVIPSLHKLTQAGFILIVISNQGGIAKGIYSKKDADEVNLKMISDLKKENIAITEVYYCPHHSTHGKCLCRKPDSLLIEKAMARFDVDPSQSFLIGDSDRDMQAAVKAGLKAFQVKKNESIEPFCDEIISGKPRPKKL